MSLDQRRFECPYWVRTAGERPRRKDFIMTKDRRNVIEVDGGRLWATLERSGEIGPGRAGGLRRLALSADDGIMRHQFVEWCRAAGCTITLDRVGNVFAQRAGTEAHLPPVVIGSHLDTQVAGGRYDGILG